MNKTYRLIWNELTRTWVAVAEIVKGRGKRASGIVGNSAPIDWRDLVLKPLALAIASMGIAHAVPPAPSQLPTGGQLVAGQAAISQSGSAMTINQGSNRAAIDWQSFNVGRAAQVKFIQPSSSSVTLNRVLDSNPSQIFGRISANGQVFLTNPNGVYFAPGASVDVGGLVATTHSISNDDFMAGNDHFNRNGATGSVINDGNLTASLNGYIALLAPEVRNSGVIVAQLGTVALAAGEAYDLQFDANNTLANIRVTPATIAALVENGNAVHAPGGLIILSAQAANRLQGGVVRNTGTLEASGLVNDGGSIRLLASDNIENTGALWANAAPNSVGRGGSVTLIADLSNANSLTAVDGSISVIGGDLGGDGGLIETSAARLSISNAARIDTHAPNGKGGQWLLDPIDISIGTDVAGATIATALQSGNVVLDSSGSGTCTGVTCTSLSGTGGNITVNDNINVTGGSADATLTLKATGSITVNAGKSISRTGSYKLNTVLWADSDGNSDGYIALSDAINTNGGQAWLGGGSGSTTWNGLTVGSGSAWGNATQVNGFYMYNGINMFNGSSISTGAGNVKLSGATAQTANYSIGVEIDYSGAGSATITTSSGNIDIIGTSTGNVGANVGAYGTLVQSGAVVASTAGGNVTIQGSGGSGGGTGAITNDGINIRGAVLANSGTINLTGTKGGTGYGINLGSGTIGYKAGTSVAASSSNINLSTDTIFSPASNGTLLQSSGVLAIAPLTAGTTIGVGTATGALSLPASYLSSNFVNGFSGITIGSATAGDIAVGGAVSYNDNLTLKTAGSITVPSGASLIGTSGQNASLVLWSDADANNNGYISLSGAINTNGGHAWLGGGALSGTAWNGLTVGSGAAWGNGTQQNGINMYGGSIISTGAGNIKLSGATSQNLDGYPCGLELGWHNGAASITTTSGNIDIIGTNTATAAGVNQGISVYGVTIASTGGGNVTLQGTGGNGNSAYGDYGVYVLGTVLANSGSINLIGTKGISGVGVRVDGTVGYKAGSSVTASSSNINVTSDTFAAGGTLQSSGTLTIAPRTAGTSIGIGTGTGTLSLPAAYFSTNFTNGFSGITVGGATAGDITVGGAVTYNDPLTLKTAGNITVSSGVSLTGTSGQNASLVLWSDADGNGDGSIWLKGSNTITTNGGHLWMGGGATDTNWNGLMVGGDGTNPSYAVGNATDSNGIEINGSTTISTAGGNIALFGKSRNGAPTAGNADGIWFNGANININSGVGTILFDGVSQGTSTGVGIGVEFYQNTQSITSAATTGDAITMRGTGTSSSSSADWTNGVFFHANEGLYATGGGNIVITGIGGATATASNEGIYFSDAVTSVVSAGAGNLTLIVDTINASGNFSGTGSLTVKPYTANSTIGIAGGSGTLKLPASYFSTNFANGFSGITIGSATAGDITVGGAVTYKDPLTLKSARNIVLQGSLTGTASETPATHLVLWADADFGTNPGGFIFKSSSANIDTKGGNLWMGGGSGSTTWNGLTVGDGYAMGGVANVVFNSPSTAVAGTNPMGAGIWIDGGSIATGGGNIAMYGKGYAGAGGLTPYSPDVSSNNGADNISGIASNFVSSHSFSINSGTGSIYMNGISGTSGTKNLVALYLLGGSITSAATSGTAITLYGDASGASTTAYSEGVWLRSLAGTTSVSATGGGGISITGIGPTSAGFGKEGVVFGDGGTGVSVTTTNGGNIAISGTATQSGATAVASTSPDVINSSGTLSVTGTGGPISLVGQVVVTGTTTLTASGQDITLTNASNDFGGATSVASGANVSLIDSNAMTLGAISSTGLVDIATLSGNLTLTGAIQTTNATASAVKLNAAKNNSAGDSTGGNIVVSGGSVSVGTDGVAKLYSGSVSGSSGLTTLIGSGTGRFRYNSDELASNFTATLTAGVYAIYREQPMLSVTPSNGTMTYGGTTPAFTPTVGTAYVNGDVSAGTVSGSAAWTIAGPTSGAGNYTAGSHNVSYSSGFASSIGYGFIDNAASTNELTVSPKTVTLSAAKTYDGSTSLTDAVTVTTGVGSETLTYTGASASSKDVADNTSNFVNAITLANGSGGGAANNYQLPALDHTNAPVTISPKAVTLTAPTISKTFDNTTAFTTTSTELGSLSSQLGVTGDTVTAVTLTYDNEDAGTGHHVVTPTLAAISSGNSNYTLNYATSASSTILPKTLTLAGLTGVDKTYDGTTAMPAASNGYGALSGVVDTAPVTLAGAVAYDSANAGSRSVLLGTLILQGPDATNYTLSWTNGSGNIAKAPLTVSANADAKFVTQSDVTGYNGVSYSGLVNGETSAVLGGTLAITRSNSGINAAGSYPGVLVPTGLTSSNYTITFTNGSYTIVPADQLLVRVQNTATTYGIGPSYTVTSAQYLAAGNVIQTLTPAGVAGTTYTYNDGASGSASFTLGPIAPQTSGAHWLKVGNYAIGASNISETSANFGNNLVVVGDLAVNQKALTPTASNVTKVYDGTTSMNGVTLGLSGLLTGDVVTVSGNGAFAQSNVGTNLNYSISLANLGSVDAGNYYLSSGNTFSGNDGAITKKTVSISASRTYDGSTALGAGTVQIDTGVAGETLTYSAATASTKNVGSGNYINAITLGNNADHPTDAHDGWASNYQLPNLSVASADNTVSFTPKALAISGITAANKVYDGNRVAGISTSGAQYEGLVNGDDLSVAATGLFDTKDAGNSKTVSLTSAYGGADVGNYSITDQASTTANISQALLTITANDANKRYGDTLSFVGTEFTSRGLVNGETVGRVTLASTGAGAAASASGSPYAISPSDASGDTFSAANYLIDYVSGMLTIAAVPEPPRPPVQPAAPLPTPASDPSPLMLITPPAVATTPQIDSTSADPTGGGVSVSLVRQPAEDVSAIIAVSVPRAMVEAGTGFTVTLPAQVAEAIVDGVDVIVTTLAGDSLPGWISYVSETRSFLVSGVPESALPMQVMIKIGKKRATMVISERTH